MQSLIPRVESELYAASGTRSCLLCFCLLARRSVLAVDPAFRLWCPPCMLPRRYIALGPGPNGDTGFVTYNASTGAILSFLELKNPFSM